MKIRPATSTMGQMVTLLGGTNVQASAPESRDMLERGVAEGILFPWGSVILFGIDKVVKYHMDVPLYVTPFVWVMNKDKYESMSNVQKKVIDSHCTSEWAEKVSSSWADFEAAGRTKLSADPNHDVYKLTPDQINSWRLAVQPTQDQWIQDVKKTGQDPLPILASLKDTLSKFKSAF
jgi:TRAP-type C4-dicarboxylate transport system substrate-binding protein